LATFEKTPNDDEKVLKEWALKTKGRPRKLTCEGLQVSELDRFYGTSLPERIGDDVRNGH
jgi:hypothetical protein